MNYSIIDMETDALLKNVTKLHCFCAKKYRDGEEPVKVTLTTKEEVIAYLDEEPCIIGHNIIKFDKEVWLKLWDYKYKGRVIDTLGMSWYCFPNRYEHGLESWGIDVGVEKPIIEDWDTLSLEVYINRCSEDVEINDRVWNIQADYLFRLYDGDIDACLRICGYITFKLDCAADNQRLKIKLDIPTAQKNHDKLTTELQKKTIELEAVMPKVPEYAIVSRPDKIHKKDGTVSEHGKKWFERLKEAGLPENHVNSFKRIVKYKEPNAGSHQQLKKWLFDLGWIPQHFKINDKFEKVPQISDVSGEGLCVSIRDMIEYHPQLAALDGYFILKHRIGILATFISSIDEDGYLISEIGGFTNTLRFKHNNPIVNLPSLFKPYGKEIRECMIAPSDEYILCGADVSGLEDSTKHHYMWPYDPEYVKEMRSAGYDPHIDIAVVANVVSKEDGTFFKWYKNRKETDVKDIYTYPLFNDIIEVKYVQLSEADKKALFKQLAKIRDKAKKTNFAAVYGAGGPKIALTAQITVKEGFLFHKAYWKRNWAVKKITNACRVKKMNNGQSWLWNPVAQFWYSLKAEKDKFSTLNQGTGAYCFDIWLRKVRQKGIPVPFQYHDEFMGVLRKENKERAREAINHSMVEANEELQLNIQLGCSIQFGDNYASIH